MLESTRLAVACSGLIRRDRIIDWVELIAVSHTCIHVCFPFLAASNLHQSSMCVCVCVTGCSCLLNVLVGLFDALWTGRNILCIMVDSWDIVVFKRKCCLGSADRLEKATYRFIMCCHASEWGSFHMDRKLYCDADVKHQVARL